MKLNAGTVLAQTCGVMVRRLEVLVLWVFLIAGAGVAVDTLGNGDPRADYIVGLVSTFGQFLTISAILKAMNIHHAWGRAGRVGSYIGLGIVGTIAIGGGFLLLLIPGLFLYARWLIAAPLVVGEGARMGNALATSWARTRDSTGALMIAIALILLPILLALGVMTFGYPEYGPIPWPAALAANILMAVGLVASWFLAAVTHALLLPNIETDAAAPTP